MSLNIIERRNTKKELAQNIKLCGLTNAELATKLSITENKLESVLKLQSNHIEDPWIVVEFLKTYAQEHDLKLMPFSKLAGDYNNYWFLDTGYISKGQIS